MNWQLVSLKYVARLRYGDALPTDVEERRGNIEVFGSNGPYSIFSRPNTASPVIVIGRKGSYGKINWSDEPIFASDTTFFVDPTTTDVHLRWLFYVLQTLNLDVGSSEAAVPGLNRETIYRQRIPLPPLPKQRAIADFLDHETANIDALIAHKQRLLDLLAVRRQTLITHAVTKGLDSKTPMKDSGVEWLGEIPSHWTVMPLRQLLESIDYGISTNLSGQGQYKVLTMGHISNGKLLIPVDGCLEDKPDVILRHHDLVFNRTNSLEQIGKVGIFEGEEVDNISIASYLVRLRANENALPKYLNYLLNSEWMFAEGRSRALPSINQANLNPRRYTSIAIPVPPIDEQRKISVFLDNQTVLLDNLTEKIQIVIQHLQERRAALIYEAVTGKIRILE